MGYRHTCLPVTLACKNTVYHNGMNTDGTLFAAVRVKRISSMQHLNACAIHGRRKDPSALKRCDSARTGQNIATSDYSTDPLDLIGAFKERKRQSGAKEYGKAPIGLHALCIVSPEVIRAGGDLHDPENPLNQQLSAEAKAWAEAEFGAGSVIATRLDVDESGGGVVDLFIVPVREMSMRGKTKPIISVNKALAEIAERHGRRKSYQSLQDSWSEHAKVLNPDIQRGKEKTAVGDDYQPPDIFTQRIEQVLSDARKRADKIITRARNKAKTIKEDAEKRGKGLRNFLNGLVGKDEKKKIGFAFDEGKKAGHADRQADVDAANARSDRERKNAENIGKELKREREDRAKDFVVPPREQVAYAEWKAQQRTKNAPAGPERKKSGYDMV